MKVKGFAAALAVLCALVLPAARAQGVEAGAAPTAKAAVPAQVPVEDFFRLGKLVGPVLSPDGRHLAAAVGNAQGRLQLVVLDLQQIKSFKTLASFTDADVREVRWVNDQRLVFSISDQQSNERPLAPGLWAVNVDGSDYRQLIHINGTRVAEQAGTSAERILPWQWHLHSTLDDDSSDVVVESPVFNLVGDVVGTKLARLDTRTGRTLNLSEGVPEHTRHWVLDRLGQVVAVSTSHRSRTASYLKAGPDWVRFDEADELDGQALVPLWMGADPALVVAARRESDTLALYALDPATRQLAPKPMLNVKDTPAKTWESLV